MSVAEKELPFELPANTNSFNQLEPGFYDRILLQEHMYKNVSSFEVKTSIHQCFACDNKKFHKPLELSNFDASVMVIGQQPSDVNFETREGKLLADTLAWAKIPLSETYFTSLIKCEESQTPERCQHHLLAELLCVQPSVVISMGYEVGKYFDASINSAGYVSNLLNKYTMVTTYHMSYAMTDQKLFEELCHHFMTAKQRKDSIPQRSS